MEMKNQPAYVTDDSRWEALKKRDMAANGIFLYGTNLSQPDTVIRECGLRSQADQGLNDRRTEDKLCAYGRA